MGHKDINKLIGTSDFSKQKIAKRSDNVTCIETCELVKVECSTIIRLFMKMVKSIAKFENTHYTCPLQYYKCSNNLVALDRLVSGYYVHQKLPNDLKIEKPVNSMKCSHGGIVDSDSFKPAKGGINKDSGYYLFSPHADLHIPGMLKLFFYCFFFQINLT